MKHLFASYFAVLFLVPLAIEAGLIGRLQGHDAGVLTHSYRSGFVGDSAPRIAAHPDQHPETSKKIGLRMRPRKSSVGTFLVDEELKALKEFEWLSPDDRLRNVRKVWPAASQQIARQIADAMSPPKAKGVNAMPPHTTNSADTMSRSTAKVEHAKSSRKVSSTSASRSQAWKFRHEAKMLNSGMKMCSVNQRLCADEALELYRIGNIVGILLDRYQVAWWATGGTLLGAVRNKGIIPHDNDLDYNILNDQAEILSSPSFIKDLKKNGLRKRIVERGFWQIKPVGKMSDIIHLDIFAMHRHLCSNQLCYPKHKWPKDTFPASLCPDDQPPERRCPALVRWPFGDSGSIWGPPEEMAQSYLNQVYGPDWHTPKCENTNHPCGLIQNMTHDATGRAEPSQNLIEPVFSKVAVNDL